MVCRLLDRKESPRGDVTLLVVAHAVRLPFSSLPIATPDVTFVGVSRSQVPDDEPHTVTFAPRELHPFAVRFAFRELEDEDGHRDLCPVATPVLIERRPGLAVVTAKHEATLETNRERYWRIAQHYFEADAPAARHEREAMLEAAGRFGQSRDPVYLRDLSIKYTALIRRGERVVIERLAADFHKSPRTIQRDLDTAEELGILPPGIRPRRNAQVPRESKTR